ncbi:MAG: hypothetical protein K6F86_08335 [Lachnospiraceae bacterium]|nr:hypothetical protein [Lachnospiraceae bacterium]
MKKRDILLMAGIVFALTACTARVDVPETAAKQEETAQEAPETSEASETDAEPEQDHGDYLEDTVLSTDLITLTMPDEFKGKFLARIDGNEISVYDKASNEAGFGGFAFSVIANADKDITAGGMYTKVGEVAAADGGIYDVCKSGPSDVQWDYETNEKMPEDYDKLYNSADDIIAGIQGNNGATYMPGAGMKGEELYPYTVSQYVTAFNEGWDANQFEEAGLSPEFYALAKSEGEKAYDEMGFAYRDISNDGVDELLVGIIDDSDEPSVVYDIYTMVDRQPTLVVSGTARNSYRAMEFGGVANYFSGGAMENGFKVYTITPGTNELFLQYGVKYDGYENEEKPWFEADTLSDEEDKWNECTEEDYNMWVERAAEQCLKLDFTPFSDVIPIDYSKVDLSKYDTFTQMLSDFKPGMGYANEKVGDTDVFFASTGTYTGEDDTKNAIDSSLFIYGNDRIVYLGQVFSQGTAYPLSLKDGYLYIGGHHLVRKNTVKDGKLIVAEEAREEFDTEGNSTYFYTDEKGKEKAVEDDSYLTKLFDEYADAVPIAFSVEKP